MVKAAATGVTRGAAEAAGAIGGAEARCNNPDRRGTNANHYWQWPAFG